MLENLDKVIKNLEVKASISDTYDFSFEEGSIDFSGLIKFDSKNERGLTVVEWDNEVPTNWEDIEDLLIAKCD